MGREWRKREGRAVSEGLDIEREERHRKSEKVNMERAD